MPDTKKSTVSLSEELEGLRRQTQDIETRRADVYRRSLEAADEEDKVCSDAMASMMSEYRPLRGVSYPITVSGMSLTGEAWSPRSLTASAGAYVKVRPCSPEYGGKTYLGVLVGDIAMSYSVRLDRESEILHVSPGRKNPAIFIPETASVVMGAGSWWGKIESPEQLRDITDDRIASVWYVQALKQLAGATTQEEQHDG